MKKIYKAMFNFCYWATMVSAIVGIGYFIGGAVLDDHRLIVNSLLALIAAMIPAMVGAWASMRM